MIYPEWLTITCVKEEENGEVSHYIAVFNDISDLKRKEEKIRQQAYFHRLTGLPNQLLLEARLRRSTAIANRHSNRLAVLFLDLDGFQHVNDTLGHDLGDMLLQEVGARLVSTLREDDTVARPGGDEFIIILEEI